MGPYIKNFSTHVVDDTPRYPLRIVAKKYEPVHAHDDGATLILTHGTGYHKEHWEPSLEKIFELAYEKGWKVREAWSIDAPNHGDAAVLNEEELCWGYSRVFDWQEYSRSIHLFLTLYDSGSYFKQRKLIGIGHSMGCVGIILAMTYLPPISFTGFVFCEPMMFPPQQQDRKFSEMLNKGAENRRDIWPSKAAALETLSSRKAFQAWDPQILKLFCEYGLRDLPTAHYPDKKDGVTLKCYKMQELSCYREETAKFRAFKYLKVLCAQYPIHIIFGDVNDYLPREVHDAMVASTEGKVRSVQRLPDCGHLVVQRKPVELAEMIFKCLPEITAEKAAMSKL